MTHDPSVTEVNVGIICACLLTSPAFLKRHGSRTFGSLMKSLLSYAPFRRSKGGSGASSNKKYPNSIKWSPGNRSNEMAPNESEYAKLGSDGNAIRIQDTTGNGSVDGQSQRLSSEGDRYQDVEAWPGNDSILMEFPANIPGGSTCHKTRRVREGDKDCKMKRVALLGCAQSLRIRSRENQIKK